jgi:hypothetical protein
LVTSFSSGAERNCFGSFLRFAALPNPIPLADGSVCALGRMKV